MNRSRVLRWLRITWTVCCGISALLLIVLWVRSYSKADICGVTFNAQKRWNFASESSRVFLILPTYKSAIWTIGKPLEWDIRSESIQSVFVEDEPAFYLKRFDEYYRVIVPHWLAVLVGAALAAAPWIKPRFSLRTLLIATTLVAVLLGLSVWLNR